MIVNTVIAALVTTFDTATTVDVHDGPFPPAVEDGDFVLVGSSGDENEDAATINSDLSDLGPGLWRDETGEIVCSSWSWSGDTDMAARRTQAITVANLCIEAVQADRTLGGVLIPPGLAEVSGLRLQQRQTTTGAIARAIWTVSYRALDT